MLFDDYIAFKRINHDPFFHEAITHYKASIYFKVITHDYRNPLRFKITLIVLLTGLFNVLNIDFCCKIF